MSPAETLQGILPRALQLVCLIRRGLPQSSSISTAATGNATAFLRTPASARSAGKTAPSRRIARLSPQSSASGGVVRPSPLWLCAQAAYTVGRLVLACHGRHIPVARGCGSLRQLRHLAGLPRLSIRRLRRRRGPFRRLKDTPCFQDSWRGTHGLAEEGDQHGIGLPSPFLTESCLV